MASAVFRVCGTDNTECFPTTVQTVKLNTEFM